MWVHPWHAVPCCTTALNCTSRQASDCHGWIPGVWRAPDTGSAAQPLAKPLHPPLERGGGGGILTIRHDRAGPHQHACEVKLSAQQGGAQVPQLQLAPWLEGAAEAGAQLRGLADIGPPVQEHVVGGGVGKGGGTGRMSRQGRCVRVRLLMYIVAILRMGGVLTQHVAWGSSSTRRACPVPAGVAESMSTGLPTHQSAVAP